MSTAPEHRQQPRHLAEQLIVRITSKRLSLVAMEQNDCLVIDLNQKGLAIESTHCFTVGEPLELEISTADGVYCNIHGVICNRGRPGQSYRFGIFFDHWVIGSSDRLIAKWTTLEKSVA